jgi:hypothetical protein
MSETAEGEPMIQDLARPTVTTHPFQDEHLEDPAVFFRGLLVAIAVSVTMWSVLIWAATKIA